ncbi:MAG: type IV pili methyl-accepting chemotaxis transducer N-terminal domain-containing protein [Pseudomonadota bacterium]
MKFGKLLSVLVASSMLAGPVVAQQAQDTLAVSQTDAEERIRTSVKIKMRAQSISAAACYLQMGMEPTALRTPLDEQIVEFEKFVTALVEGDASLNITQPEARKKTHFAAERVTNAWVPVKDAAMNIVAGNGAVTDTDVILSRNLDILEQGHNFTAELVQQYANPAESTLADLFTIVISTRQGMLSQKISKEACMVTNANGSSKKLGETMSVFENTLFALRDGMPGTGIEAAPTAAIAERLSEAIEQWTAVKPLLEEAKSGANIAPEQQALQMDRLNDLKVKMLDVSTLYVDYMISKRS